jgi:ATP-binding cassette subfamily B protein
VGLAPTGKRRLVTAHTHRLSFVARADAIMVVDGGHLVQVGRHEALLGSCLPYKQLWSQQARVYQ